MSTPEETIEAEVAISNTVVRLRNPPVDGEHQPQWCALQRRGANMAEHEHEDEFMPSVGVQEKLFIRAISGDRQQPSYTTSLRRTCPDTSFRTVVDWPTPLADRQGACGARQVVAPSCGWYITSEDDELVIIGPLPDDANRGRPSDIVFARSRVQQVKNRLHIDLDRTIRSSRLREPCHSGLAESTSGRTNR
ncbi:hypothetical protein AAFF_G00069770 [Aldrovandia affinis]|uniref:Uncharacterized protein n=1 Tax=Aldrovandia affinis TaxID=143900 RepID=A0AAD7R205_9TELE|nr:hypothetical protein AAFF_G00069770 [Aldrovandia affinis]